VAPLLGREGEFAQGVEALVVERDAFWKRWNSAYLGPAGPVEWMYSDEAERPTPFAAATRAAEMRPKVGPLFVG
jgi:hypothetical protein